MKEVIFQPTPPKDYFVASKITATFDYGKKEGGTGWIAKHNNSYWLLTCQHVISPKYRNVTDQRKLVQLDIEFFVTTPTIGIGVNALPQRLTISNPKVKFDETELDIAAIHIIDWANTQRPKDQLEITISDFATIDELYNLQPGIQNYFVGYPANSPNKIFTYNASELKQTYPFLRQGIFAAPPSTTFAVQGQLGGERYCWLDSFAVSGFSGAPIFVPQFGFSDDEGGQHFTGTNRPRKLVGMICGHQDVETEHGRTHSGLSYFVNSHYLHRFFQILPE